MYKPEVEEFLATVVGKKFSLTCDNIQIELGGVFDEVPAEATGSSITISKMSVEESVFEGLWLYL
jgi:hypothetical protein